MSLFELSRLWDVFPLFSGSQELRGLFRQAPTSSSGERLCAVFTTPSYLFIASRQEESGEDCVHVLSVAGESTGSRLPLTQGEGETVAVLSLEGQVCVVRERGGVEVFHHQHSVSWKKTGSVRLTSGHIFSCVAFPDTCSLVYCVRLQEQPADHTHQVLTCHYTVQATEEDGSEGVLKLRETAVLLSACPAVRLWSWREGVLLEPVSGPPGLLLFWLPHHTSQLKPFILNSCSVISLSPVSTHYPSLCLSLAPLWTVTPRHPWLVSVTVTIATRQLLLLLSSGELVSMETSGGRVHVQSVTRLCEFLTRYPLPPPPPPPPAPPNPVGSEAGQSSQLQLFTLHTYCGIFNKGAIRMYELRSGEMVWENDEYESHDITLLAPPSSHHWVGIYGNSGVWLLRSRRLSEHTQLLTHSLFPISTNADETTPGDYLKGGGVMSATLSLFWGLPLPATRHGLLALHTSVQRDEEEEEVEEGGRSGDRQLFLPHVSSELERLLRSASLQSPALLVALLTEYPAYRNILHDSVNLFLQQVDLHGNTATHMTKEVSSLLASYQTLLDDYNYQLKQTGVARQLLLSPSAKITALLQELEGCHGNSRVCMRAQLQSLGSCSTPLATPPATLSAALSGLTDYFSVGSFKDAVERGGWSSNRDWKTLFGSETGSSLRRGAGLEDTLPYVPIFELTCRLLYRVQPDELVSFVSFAQLSRDLQAQGDSSFARRCRSTYFYQRAVQCLPQYVCDKTTPTSQEAVLAHSLLIMKSGYSGCEGWALRLLLKAKLWQEALDFVTQQTQSTPHTYCGLFHSLLVAMVQSGVLSNFMERVWKLMPHSFSVFDFLSVLSHAPPHPAPPPLLVPDYASLSVGDIRGKLQLLLDRSYIHRP